MNLRFPTLLLLGLTLAACSGGGEPFQVETPEPNQEQEDPNGVDNAPPVAVAGEARVVAIGAEVALDGTASSDPDGDTLSFAWAFADKPSDSEAVFNNASSATPRFTADKAGRYEIELTVSDGTASSKDTVTIRANSEPIAHAGGAQTSEIDVEVILDGSQSSDPDGDALTYAWAFISQPDGSEATLANANAAVSSFTPDVTGQFVLELTVSDGYAQSSDRVTISVTSEGGVDGTILYVSPAGDDANAGTKAAPLATVAEAFERAKTNTDIKRFILASGTYDEGFDHQVSRKLEIVGPAEGEDAAILKGAGRLFNVVGKDASLALLRVRLESEGLAVQVLDEASLSVTHIECEAKGCIDGTDADDEQRASGTVQVSKSSFVGISDSVAGIDLQNGSLTITDSHIESFSTGISLFHSSFLMRESTVGDTSQYSVSLISSNGEALIEKSQIEGSSDTGLYLYGTKAALRETKLYGAPKKLSSAGILMAGPSSIDADEITIIGFQRVGIELSSSIGKKKLKMRNSLIEDNGNGIAVLAKDSEVDLGNQSEAGNNAIKSVHIAGRSRGYCIDDQRPADSDGSGYIRMSETKLRGEKLPAGSYAKGHATYKCGESPRTLCIENAGNTVIVH